VLMCPSVPWEGALHQHVCSIISIHTHTCEHTQLGPWLLAGASVFASDSFNQVSACLRVCVSVFLCVCVSVCRAPLQAARGCNGQGGCEKYEMRRMWPASMRTDGCR
jgi:hypothetical protein